MEEFEKPWICRRLDSFISGLGNLTAWLTIVLMITIIVQVFLRYFLNRGISSLEELQWHLYAAMFIIAISYAFVEDAHIRLDLFHRKFSARRKAWIELLGILFLLLPMVVVGFIHGIPFAVKSWSIGERSAVPTGLPYRWIIKSILPLGMGLLGLSAASRLLNSVVFLVKGGGDRRGNQ